MHLVVGAGEVGAAVAAVLARADHRVSVRDVEPVDVQAEVLHVCFPWSDGFTAEVQRYEREHGAELVVVHSTVPVGTCDPHGWVHSPVRGRHPGAADTEAGKLVELLSYAQSIVFEKAVHAWCAERGLDFDTVYTTFRHAYNDGYIAMGHPEFVQPVLRHIAGGIGGHCIVPSMALLDHPLAEQVVAASRAAEAELA